MSNKGKELYDQGNEERLRGNYDRCVSLWKNAATWFKNQGYQKQTSTILSDIGFLYYQLGQYDTAERYFNNSLVITKSINYKEHEGWNINYLGLIYQRRGELEKAFENFLEALKIAEFVGDTIGENQCLNNIGSVYYRKGDLNEALKYFKKSLDIVMRENDLEGKERCFNNIASVYFSWKNFERALEYYNSSLEILRLNEKENRLKIGRRLHNLGQVFRSLGNQNQAIFLFGESLEITKATSDKHSLGIISHSLGETYLDMKQADLALEYLKTSYQVAIDENDTRGLVRILIDQGLGYKYKKQYREAFKRFGDALNLAKPFADQESIAICYNNMGRIYQLQRNYLEAINYYEEAFKVLDEFYSIVPSEDIRIEARIQLNTVLNNLVQSLTIISDFDKALAYIDYNKGREMLLTQIEAYRSPFFILNEKIPKSESMQEKSELVQLRDEINSLKQQLSNIKNKLKWYQDQSKLGNKEILDVEEARLMKKQKAILTTLRSKEEEVFIRFPTQGLVLPKNPIKIIQEIHSKIISGWLIIEFYYDREREKLMVFWIEKKKKTEMSEKGLTNEEMKRLEDTAKKIIELRSKAKVDSRYEAEDCLIKLSNLLFEVLFPKELKSYLKNNQFEFITLIPTGALHTLPLELIHDGNEFWSLKYNISRAFNLQTLLAAIHGTQTSQEESGLFIVAPLVDMDIKVEELVPYMGTGTIDKLNRTAETT
ncbi:MAG: tetratricopeptide repeat protein, partial [Candidatus Hermodarchaeota archaeon]